MVYTIWYISLGLWYMPVESGIYHDATFQMKFTGRYYLATATTTTSTHVSTPHFDIEIFVRLGLCA